MKVASVNVGRLRLIQWADAYESTGIFKEPVTGPVAVHKHGLAGDRQASDFHGGEFRAVYIYPAEHYEYWAVELNRPDLTPGMFGENLTVSGLREDELHVGDVLKVGTAVVQATEPRFPCYKLGIRVGDQSVVEKFRHAGRHGSYFRVLEEGAVQAGDSAEYLECRPDGVSLFRVAQIYLGLEKDPLVIGPLLELEATGPGLRRKVLQALQQAEAAQKV